MTYAELLAEVEKLVPDASVHIEVGTWRHVHEELGGPQPHQTTWKVSTFVGTNVRAQVSDATPERVLERLRFELSMPGNTCSVNDVVIDMKESA